MQLDKHGIRTGLPPLRHPAGAPAEACLPYVGKWLPAAVALGHVMRVDRCDRLTAIRQIEAAVFDRALRWVRNDSNRWSWDAKVYWADVLKLWPSPNADQDMSVQFLPPDAGPKKSNLPPPMHPLRGGRNPAVADRPEIDSRAPRWQVWKHIPNLKPYQAVALSLNIDPEKVRQNRNSWMFGARLFEENQEFKDRLFVLSHNLMTIGIENLLGVRYYDDEPLLRLDRFTAWAKGLGWALPPELSDLSVDGITGSSAAHLANSKTETITRPEDKPQRVEIPKKRNAVKLWIAEHYPHGIPAGSSHKEIVRQFEADTKILVSERTVRRALGRS